MQLFGSTDAAAIAIGGKTTHSIMKYGLRKRQKSDYIRPSTTERREAIREKQEEYSETTLLVIDEFSMIGKKILSQIEISTSAIRLGNHSSYFGSLPVVVQTGDFYQHPHVLDEVLYNPLLGVRERETVMYTSRGSRPIGHRPPASEFHHPHDVWNSELRLCIFLRKG